MSSCPFARLHLFVSVLVVLMFIDAAPPYAVLLSCLIVQLRRLGNYTAGYHDDCRPLGGRGTVDAFHVLVFFEVIRTDEAWHAAGIWLSGMSDRRPVDVTILICTRNRHVLLGETLDSVAELSVPADWRREVLVVDNASTDATPATVLNRVARYPFPLRYLHEPALGKSSALNAGIGASAATVLACADDDVRVGRNWLIAACRPLLARESEFAYTGGPVRPIWDGPCPDWFPQSPSALWGTIAILDYGSDPFVFEDQRKVPIGANFAIRRDLVERVGGFVPALGRSTTRTPLGQELPELFRRARAAGERGLYVPSMEVFHHIPASRLTQSYCRRWWFGKGISRARVDRIHPITELGLDLRATPHLARVPRFMFGDAWRDIVKWTRVAILRRPAERVQIETRLCYFAGYVWDRQRDRWRRQTTLRAPAIIPARSTRVTIEVGR